MKGTCKRKTRSENEKCESSQKRVKVVNVEYHVYCGYDIPTFENNVTLKEKD